MIFQKITIIATPDQVESKWDLLTDYQKSQVALARATNRNLHLTIVDTVEKKILYHIGVC